MFGLFAQAPEGAALIREFPSIQAWWERTRVRPSVLATSE